MNIDLSIIPYTNKWLKMVNKPYFRVKLPKLENKEKLYSLEIYYYLYMDMELYGSS